MSRKPTILLTDDSDAFLMYMSVVIARMGLEVIPVDNGSDAIKLASIMDPDMILLDVIMPDVDGLTVLRHLRQNDRLSHIPVVMLTIVSEDQKIRECENLGCSGYITKPIHLNEFHEQINKHLKHRDFHNRQFLRTSYEKKIRIIHESVSEDYFAETLSERGIYIRMKDTLPVNTSLQVSLQLNDQELTLNGTVIYKKGLRTDVFRRSPGVAIQFTNLNTYESMLLKEYITEQLIGDIVQEQREQVFIKKPEKDSIQ